MATDDKNQTMLSPHENALLGMFTKYKDAHAFGKEDKFLAFFLLLFASLISLIGFVVFSYFSFSLWREHKSIGELFPSLVLTLIFMVISLTPYAALDLHKQIKRWYIKEKLNL